ncbi:MAG: alanine--tRNA ligase [Candidatus Paceibacterota bacterium]
MKSDEIRSRFLEFFKKRGHAIIPSASLVPENDPSVLFTTAGMQPLVPYLLGEKHPAGNKLADVQKCIRTQDIDEVGDNTHDTFFEMLGNWSLGDYFKKDAIKWSYEFLTSKEEGLGLDPKRLYITVFEGDENAPQDTESEEIWINAGIPKNRIYTLPASKNWWSAGENGPCGPDTEMYYDITPEGLGDLSFEEFAKADEEQKVIEIWNDVFMEYLKKDGKVVGKLNQQNVDTGAGLERMATVLQKKDNVFDTDLFEPIMKKIDELASVDNLRARRIVADHIRTSTFVIADGVTPSNTDRGYILRRLLRRAVRYADVLNIKNGGLSEISETVIEKYKHVYPNLEEEKNKIKSEINREEEKFRQTLERAIKEFDKSEWRGIPDEKIPNRGAFSGHAAKVLPGEIVFNLYQSYGLPIELTEELAKEKGLLVSREDFNRRMSEHQELSRTGAEKKFKGGLADTSEISVKYHTATHMLNAALRQVLGDHIMQKGSNITVERLRFDFSHPQKVTPEELKKVEDIVNQKIKEALPVTYQEIPKEEAEKTGAIHAFGEKYGDMVKVYTIGNEELGIFSREFCGGPHVSNTSELGSFKITKEEAVSAGVRRIKAVLE